VNKKGEVHLQTKRWRDAQDRCREALRDLRVSPVAGPLGDAEIFEKLKGLDEIHNAGIVETAAAIDTIDTVVLPGKYLFPELIQHVAKHFSQNPESVWREVCNQLALGKLHGVGYGLGPNIQWCDVLSAIPPNFWRVADFDVAKFLTDASTPNEVGMKIEPLEFLLDKEPSIYQPKPGEYVAYRGIEFDGRDVRRLWP
jgi:hypothetical protein